MALDESSPTPPELDGASGSPSRPTIPPAKRKRLQKAFEHASKQMAQENHDYASELLSQCVMGDPDNLIYVQSYIGNLQKKYNGNKTGAKMAQFKERGARSATKKALSHEKWDEVIQHGLKVLTVNPWDVAALTAMATASEKMGDEEVELFYLRCALDANIKDPAVNRHCAQALEARGEFDQAIACWYRVQQAKPNDEEVQHEIGRLTVEKTIHKGGYEDRGEAKKLGAEEQAQSEGTAREAHRVQTPISKLQAKIDRDPRQFAGYQELAQLHVGKEDYKAAEEVLAKAVQSCHDEEEEEQAKEAHEDAQLRCLRQELTQAEDDATKLKIQKALIIGETEHYRNQCERYPTNLTFRYELGRRYQMARRYKEAIKQYQSVRNEPRHKGMCMYRLGQCFQQIKQYRLAMSHYEEAVREIPDRDENHRKKAFYLAGKLALGLKDFAKADKHLTDLAALDFDYKDVSSLLDKVAELRDNA